jgi:hypothetical protein
VRQLLRESKWNEAATEMNEIRTAALVYHNNDELALGMAEVIDIKYV